MSRLVGGLEHEMLHADHDQVDAYYRAMGKTEGEIASYRQTRVLQRMLRQQKQVHPTFLGSINGIPIDEPVRQPAADQAATPQD